MSVADMASNPLEAVPSARPQKAGPQVAAVAGGWVAAQCLAAIPFSLLWGLGATYYYFTNAEPPGFSIVVSGGFDWSMRYAGDAFGGMFTAATARRSRLRCAAWAGILLGLWVPLASLLQTTFMWLQLGAENSSWLRFDVWQRLVHVDRWMLLKASLHPLFFLIGGWLQVQALRRGEARPESRDWRYETSSGRSVEARTPWHHDRLAKFWAGVSRLFFGSIWIPVLAALAPILISGMSLWPLLLNTVPAALFSAVQWYFVGLACGALAMKHRAASVGELLAKDARAPVLYLRSFVDDGTGHDVSFWRQLTDAVKSLLQKTYEQHLAQYAEKLGPFVAIGRPGEELPELGAARMYVSNEDWQDVAKDLITRSQLVILQVGKTGGVRWELDRVDELKRPEDVILFIPFALLRNSHRREAQFAHFLEWGRQCLPGHLPDQLGKASFIYFEPGTDWTARTLAYKGEVLASHPHADLLRKLSRDKAFRPQPLISLFGWILIALLGSLVLLLLGFLFLISRR